MKKMRKTLLWLLVLLVSVSLVGVFSLNSCKKEVVTTEEEAEEEAAVVEEAEEVVPAEEKEEEVSFEGRVLTIAASQNWITDAERVQAEDFTKETGIIVDIQVNPDDQYLNIIKTKLSAGEAPDIFFWGAGLTLKQIPAENVFDLSNEPWVPRLKDWARNGATVDEKLWGLNIWSADGWAMLYNTGIFDKYNLTPPKNYTEFLNICETLENNGILPIYEFFSELWHPPLYLSEAAGVVNYNNPGTYDKLNNGELKFVDIPEFVLVLTQLKELADKGYLGKDYMSNLWNDAYKAMGTGEAAMYLGSPGQLLEIDVGYPDSGAKDFKGFPSPLGFTGEVNVFAVSAGGVVQLVNKDTKNLDLVRAYFEFITRDENLQKFYEKRVGFLNPSFEGINVEPLEAVSSITELVDGNLGMEGFAGILFFDMMTTGKYIEEMMLGTSTPVQVLEKIDVDREKLLEIVD